jgi:alpha-beta hydrolase superfamily lysophospholipase
MDTRTATAHSASPAAWPSAALVQASAPAAQPLPPLRSVDGLQLHVAHWPATAPLRGTVQLVHGLGEHLGRYAEVAQRLNAQGWQVVAHDHRGHGRSEGPRGALPDSAALLADLAAVLDHTRLHLPVPGPQVLFGHSLGGLVAGRFVAETLSAVPAAWSRAVDALVMSSPALDPGMNAAQKALLAVLGPLAPHLAVGNGLRPEWICSDPAVVQAYVADPLVHGRVTPRLVRFIVDAGAQVLECAPLWRTPTLLMWAGADRCVAPAGSATFAATAPAAVVQAQAFPTLRHEIFNEPDRAAVFATLEAWLQGRLGAA